MLTSEDTFGSDIAVGGFCRVLRLFGVCRVAHVEVQSGGQLELDESK